MTGRWTAAFLGVLFVGAAGAPGPAPRQDAWTVVGPGGGGTMRRPAISPHDPRLVVEGCDMTGAYITRDAGESWRMFHLGGVVEAFAFDPSDARVLYAANSVLLRSEDAGGTWRIVFPDPAQNTVEHGWGDHADTVFTSDDPLYPSGQDANIQAVVVDPADPRHLVIAMSATAPGPPGSHPSSRTTVLASTDRGRTWARQGELGVERVFALWVETGVVRAIGETGAYEGSGQGWHRYDPPGGQKVTSGGFGRDAKTKRTRAYVTTEAGISVSDDGGHAWREASGSLGAMKQGAGDAAWGPAKGSKPSLGPIAASASHGLVAYVGLRGLRRAPGDAPFNGIAKTTDGGATWTVVNAEPDRPSPALDGSWIEERALEDGHSVWFDAPYDLAVAPGDPDVCYATDLFRTYRTTDGGRAWAQVNSVRRGPDQWATRGLDVTTAYGVHWDPFDLRRVFITYTDIGLFRSEDGGASWIGSSRGVPTRWRNTTYWVAFDPEVKGRMWGAFSGTHDLPRPKMWRRTDPERFQGGVGVSNDGGRTWTPSNAGMPESAITHVLLDPTSKAGSRTLYATAYARRLQVDGRRPHVDAQERGTAGAAAVRLADDACGRRDSLSRGGTPQRARAHRRRRRRRALSLDGRGRALDAHDPSRRHQRPERTRLGPRRSPPAVPGRVGRGDARRRYGGRDLPEHGRGSDVDERAAAVPARLRRHHRSEGPRHPLCLRVRPGRLSLGRSRRDLDAPPRVQFQVGPPRPARPRGREQGLRDDLRRQRVARPGHGRSGGGGRRGARALARGAARGGQHPGIHAYQVKLARKDGKGDPPAVVRLSDAEIGAGRTSGLAPGHRHRDGQGLGRRPRLHLRSGPRRRPLLRSELVLADTLPLNVYTAYLTSAVPGRPRAHVRAIANLYQTVLEVERDGDVLQDLFRFDIGLGLPVYAGQLGLPGSDADLLAVGQRLEGKSCASPVGTTAVEWQIAGRKIWNWGEKNQHIRDARVVGDELLAEPAVAALVPKMRALPAQRVAVIGHSFTMDLHWSSPSAFVPIVTAMFARENPKVEFRQFQGGGLTSTRAYNRFFPDVLAWKPDRVLLVVLNRTDEDLEHFARFGKALSGAGARVYSFDDLHDPDTTDPARLAKEWATGRASGITIVEVSRLLSAAPDRARFVCLDGIHMTEPWHRLMAKEWLKLLVGARAPALEN
jgi:hypothetical protein